MKVLIVNKYAHVTGGADRYCLASTELLRRAGHDVRWLSTASASNAERDGAFVSPRPNRAFWNREAAAATERELRDFGPDLLHCHKLYPHLSVAPVVSAARASVPIVQTAHDYEFCSPDEWAPLPKRAVDTLLFPVRRRVHVPRISRFVAPSEFVARALAAAGIESSVVRHFVETRAARLRFEERDGVFFAGRLVPQKGVDELLLLAARLPELRFSVAGTGPLEGRVRGAGSVRYLGGLEPDAVLDELGRARVAVVPSRWAEPAGLVALEAMAAGTPVAASAAGGLAEYVGAAGGAVLSTLEAMSDAIRTLHSDAVEWERASAAGLAAVQSLFTPERHLAELERVYRSALDG